MELALKYQQKCKIKYERYYILKCDISKFFANIDQERLKIKLERHIKDKEALEIIFKIINNDEKGLSIGNMTSQVLAIFYLNDLDHFIKEKLKIKYYVRYQDDFLLFHNSKQYLNYCLEQIKIFLDQEKLTLNKKSRIYSNNNNFIFLGRTKEGKYAKYKDSLKKLKRKKYLYKQKEIDLQSIVSTIVCYKGLYTF